MIRLCKKWIHANDFDKSLLADGWEIVDTDDLYVLIVKEDV